MGEEITNRSLEERLRKIHADAVASGDERAQEKIESFERSSTKNMEAKYENALELIEHRWMED